MRPSPPSLSLYIRIINLSADRVSRNPIKIFATLSSSFHINYGDLGGPKIASTKASRSTARVFRRQRGADEDRFLP